MASGFAKSADADNVYVIHADGTSEPIDQGWLSGCIDIKKGDTILMSAFGGGLTTGTCIMVWE